MSLTLYLTNFFKRGLSMVFAIGGVFLGIAIILYGTMKNSIVYFYGGIFIIILAMVIAKFFYWKHKDILRPGHIRRSRYVDY